MPIAIATEPERPEGWARLVQTAKYHYFLKEKDTSICGKVRRKYVWSAWWSKEAPDTPRLDRCGGCLLKLDQRQKKK